MADWLTGRARTSGDKKKRAEIVPRSKRRLSFAAEPLEQRLLMSISPTLVSIISNVPNEGDLITLNGQTTIHQAPSELTFRFDIGQLLDPTTLTTGTQNTAPTGIKIVRSGNDGVFGNGNDVSVGEGFVGLPLKSNEAVVRFLNTLPDDTYQITIVGAGAGALKNTAGQAYNNGVNSTINFRLDLGAQVVSVVPQPITRDAQGNLHQVANQVQVYFNNDKLNTASAQDVTLYQLLYTAGTASNLDDVLLPAPTSAVYNPNANLVTLTFSDNLYSLLSTTLLSKGLPAPTGISNLRLRIGDNGLTVAPLQVSAGNGLGGDVFGGFGLGDDLAGSSFGTSFPLGVLTSQGMVVTGAAIDPPGTGADNPPYDITLPGNVTDPGQRNIPAESHIYGSQDSTPGITVQAYNFQNVYGTDPQGNLLFNQISEVQKQRVREIYEIYGHYLGIQFVETANQGTTVAVGDLRAADPGVSSGPGGVAGLGSPSLALMDNAENWGNNEFGGSFFDVAMHEIGHSIGLGHSYDAPAHTVQGDTSTPTTETTVTQAPEPIFPGDLDILDGQYLYRPESKDIDLYTFTVSTTGRFNAETVAERLASDSLDTVLTLYDRSTGAIIARNDDYFSSDSFLNLTLSPGTYTIAVTSTGNTQFDPNVPDSGFGGTTQGAYNLRLNFTPSSTGVQMVDLTGTPLDGDIDGVPGGDFNFWFNVADPTAAGRYIIVDKSASGVLLPGDHLGSITDPYNNIATAMAAAQTGGPVSPTGAATLGSIVRVVGNGGADGDLSTVGDNRAYEIGYNILGGVLQDGSTLNVKEGVDLMIDAGALFKLRGANINAGSFAQGIALDGGSIQVLGTPTLSAQFTSYNDESKGVDTFALPTKPQPGDWGGLVFQDDSDYEKQGIFLNYVSFANLGYGGGAVVVNSTQQVYDPLHLITARPTLLYNTIHDSADAPISADPNSFEETLFRNDTYMADYSRVGPLIHGNILYEDRLESGVLVRHQNSINGLFVRIRTVAGAPIDVLSVTGRFASTDIVYVISENLWVQGTPGGGTGSLPNPDDSTSWNYTSRLDASLTIDPGVVVKLKGSRIEVGVGSQLIAEGRDGSPVVFTSLLDDRYGAGGTFDTTGDGATSKGNPGDWGGLDFDAISKGSLDHVVITYAGGITPIEGTFARFDAVEIRQATVRLTNSVLENNADGFDGSDRNGRGINDATVIFVRGAQPVIVNDIVRNNSGDAISINANALNAINVIDWGRSTGRVDLFNTYNDNYGPLVRQNVLIGNDINGMEVRGAVITTQTIWDDTDIVHVLRSGIDIPNTESVGGLRLQSSPTHSLVVKLLGGTAGFTASGKPLDITNRIGGTLQIIGTPGHDVVLTSLNDSNFGAGLDLDGKPQNNTVGSGTPPAGSQSQFKILFNLGPAIKQNPAAIAALQQAAAGWEAVFDDPITIRIDFELDPNPDPNVLGFSTRVSTNLDYDQVRAKLIADASSNEAIVNQIPTFAQLQTTLGSAFTIQNKLTVARADALALGFSPSVLTNTPSSYSGGVGPIDGSIHFNSNFAFDYTRSDGIDSNKIDFISVATHEIGHALGFISSVDSVDTGDTQIDLSTLDLFRVAPGTGASFATTPRVMTPGEPAVFYDGGVFNKPSLGLTPFEVGDIPLSTGAFGGDGNQASHWKDNALLGTTATIGIMDPNIGPGQIGSISQADTRALGLIGWNAVTRGSAGDWNGITLGKYSNDRNVDVIPELENAYTGAANLNGTTTTAQYLGILAPDQQNGDENRRLGFEVHGSVSFDNNTDTDVYSFNALPGTKVWFDIDKTSTALDSVIELIDANGNVLARSNDSEAELQNPSLLFSTATVQAFPLNGSEFSNGDLYTSNPKDAGMRLELPGTAGVTSTYYVRVRSNVVGNGVRTSGNYQLQIRLQDQDEIPGSTVRFADIHFPTNGITVLGLPDSSPLVGTSTRATIANSLPATAQDLGNLLGSDQNNLDVSSALTSVGDVDWYKFNVSYNDIQSIAGLNDGGKTWATVFDIDYADGVGRPDTTLFVYQSLGIDPNTQLPILQLVYIAGDSDISDDQPDPLNSSSQADLSRGSSGKLDPFLGTVQLAEGATKTYYVAVTNTRNVPLQLGSKLFHLQPVDSVKRIVEDHIGSTGFNTRNPNAPFDATKAINVPPVGPAILPIADQLISNPNTAFPNTQIQQLSTHVAPYTMADLQLFVSTSDSRTLWTVNPTINPTTGQVPVTSASPLFIPGDANYVDDITIRSDGVMMGTLTQLGLTSPDNRAGELVAIDPTTGLPYPVGIDNIPDPPTQTTGTIPRDSLTSFTIGALAYERFAPGDPLAGITPAIYEPYSLVYAVPNGNMSYLYAANPATGDAKASTTNLNIGPVGGSAPQKYAGIFQDTPGDVGRTTGMTYVHYQGLELDLPAGNSIISGQTFTVSDIGVTKTFQFHLIGTTFTPLSVGNIALNYNAGDTETMVEQTFINLLNSPSTGLAVSASANTGGFIGGVLILNAFAATSGNALVSVFALPNGGNVLLGVSDTGQFFSIEDFRPYSIDSTDPNIVHLFPGDDPTKGLATRIASFGVNAPFTGLALGPQNLDLNGDGKGGDLANTVFAITAQGDIYAILYNPLTGTATLRTDVFPGGVNHISTGLVNATGLTFGLGDFNLWHPTNSMAADPGHGADASPDSSGFAVGGGTSFYFGMENQNASFLKYRQISQFGTSAPTTSPAVQNSQFGELFGNEQLDMTRNAMRIAAFGDNATGLAVALSNGFAGATALRQSEMVGNNYNLAGGVHGDLITNGFDLTGYSSTDKPTLYFNYYLEKGNVGDSLSLSVSPDDGKTWITIPATLVTFTSEVKNGTSLDPTWRQARVDLSPLLNNTTGTPDPGQPNLQGLLQQGLPVNNLKLKFTFTADTKDNNYKGFAIDDIIVGFAEHGEMVTMTTSAVDAAKVPFTPVAPTDALGVFVTLPEPAGSAHVNVGAYQLQIRRGTEYADAVSNSANAISIFQQSDTNDRMSSSFSLDVPGAFALVTPVIAHARDAFSDGQLFSITDAVGHTLTFEIDMSTTPDDPPAPAPKLPFGAKIDGNGVSNGHIPVQLLPTDDAVAVTRKIMLAINGRSSVVPATAFFITAILDTTGTKLYLKGTIPAGINTGTSPLTKAAQISDGDTFTISDSFHSRTFEFDNNNSTTAGNIKIPFVSTDLPTDIAGKVVAAINGQNAVNFTVDASQTGTILAGSATPRPGTSNQVDLFGAAFVDESNTPNLAVVRNDSLGDRNPVRQQGEIILQGNIITNASGTGIIVDNGSRDGTGSHAGAARNLAALNLARLVPGVVVMNNIIDSAGTGGILFSGDPNLPGLPNAVTPFGRIVNNTIYGAGTGIGILVTDNSSPTILNNILASLSVGIAVDPTSATTILGANLFQANGSNTAGAAVLSPFDIVQQNNYPLFVNAPGHNFNLLKTNSTNQINQAIDSSLDTLQDRAAMIQVDGPMGIGVSPIIAPAIDATGKLRVDDPGVNPPLPGLGSNVYKDRGALDRSDFAGPIASLLNPLDNDANDQNTALNSVVRAGQALNDFEIQISDGIGAGIDNLTVDSSSFKVYVDQDPFTDPNATPLSDGVQYIFGYNANDKIAFFTPVVGIWESNHVYTIVVDNNSITGIKDLAGNTLLPNEESTGLTRFTIALLPLDFGDAPSIYPTLFANDGARHVIANNGLFLGAGVSAEPNGQPSPNAEADTQDDGVVFNSVIMSGTTATITVTASKAGKLDAWIDFNGDGDWLDAGEQIYTSQQLVAGANTLTFAVPATTATTTFARFRLSTAGGLAPTGLALDGEVEDYKVTLTPPVNYTVKLFNPVTNKELPKDASGEYVALAGTTFQAQVYVTDVRNVGATGGVYSAFADLTRNPGLVTWVNGSLVVNNNFANGVSGTIDAGQQIIDEAGGLGIFGPPGSQIQQLLFTVNGVVSPAIAPGTVVSIATDAADQPIAHQTSVFGFNDAVSATYGSAQFIVPIHPWQNPDPASFRTIGGKSVSLDVDASGVIVGLDALKVINKLFNGGNGLDLSTAVFPNVPPPYYDVDGDGRLLNLDALYILSYLSQQSQQAQQQQSHLQQAPLVMQPDPVVLKSAPLVAADSSPSATTSTTATASSATSDASVVVGATPLVTASLTVQATPSVAATPATAPLSASAAADSLFGAADATSVDDLSRDPGWSTNAAMGASIAAQSKTTAVSSTLTLPASEASGVAISATLQNNAVSWLYANHSENASLLDLEDVSPRLGYFGGKSKTKLNRI